MDAKLFMPGRSQAVRLPKAFRFGGGAVRILKIGERVILEPLEGSPAMPWSSIDATGEHPFMPDGREQPAIPEDRSVFEA